MESPLINTQSAAISLASLQPPLMTMPPLQPRPATTGALDLMLPLQPKLLPGYNLQTSYLSSTLSTVRPPDFLIDKANDRNDFKPKEEAIVEDRESFAEVSTSDNVDDKVFDDINVDRIVIVNHNDRLCKEDVCINNDELKNDNHNVVNCPYSSTNDYNSSYDRNEINSNVIDAKTVDSSLAFSESEDSPNNNSY